MSYQKDDRVLIRPLGIRGTVLGPARVQGTVRVQADNEGPPLPWLESELEPPPPLHTQFSSLNDD